ncbi:MAG: sugar phosphate isomerase/epimerase [Gammaproteobacteria bacterium]|nr:sugar phosphate isomerase/epimerase [Gammaproteobacteria bacterium]
MAKPISVQLYSLREASQDNFDGVLERLADIGYAGVEPYNLFGKTPVEFKRQVEDLGMRISSSHFPWANHSPINEVIDVTAELGLKRAAGGFGPDDFKNLDTVKHTAQTVNELIEALKGAGLDLFLHNHWWEFAEIDGRLIYHILQELSPEVLFEVDTYWVANFGAVDPVAEVRRVRDRAPLLHIKDGPLQKDQAHVAVGDGKLNIAGIIEAADPDVLEWIIVELDACDTDMMTAIEQSYRYLTDNDLAQGQS